MLQLLQGGLRPVQGLRSRLGLREWSGPQVPHLRWRSQGEGLHEGRDGVALGAAPPVPTSSNTTPVPADPLEPHVQELKAADQSKLQQHRSRLSDAVKNEIESRAPAESCIDFGIACLVPQESSNAVLAPGKHTQATT